MSANLAQEIANLPSLDVTQLRRSYASAFGEPTNSRHKTWLIKRVAWRLQALAEGDLSERARQRARELANDADLRLSAPKLKANHNTAEDAPSSQEVQIAAPAPANQRLPSPGSILTRLYKGQQLQVTVLNDGFAYGGKVYGSLSAVAKAITGSHCNGFLFFRLPSAGGDR